MREGNTVGRTFQETCSGWQSNIKSVLKSFEANITLADEIFLNARQMVGQAVDFSSSNYLIFARTD